MTLQKAFKFRIYPSEAQQAELAIQFGHARFVYNAALELRKDYFFLSGKSLSYEDTANALVEFKRNNPDLEWLSQADSQVLQQSLKDLDKAYQHYFRNLREGTLPAVHPARTGCRLASRLTNASSTNNRFATRNASS
jgi:putative transposase